MKEAQSSEPESVPEDDVLPDPSHSSLDSIWASG